MTDSALVELAEDYEKYVLSKAVGRIGHGLATGIGYALLAAAATGVIHDRVQEWNSVEMHLNVHELARVEDGSSETTELFQKRDFDGDGVVDDASVIEYRVVSAFGRGIWKLLTVKSGRTGEDLLVRGLGFIDSVKGWVGDHDGNGTIDLEVKEYDEFVVLGYVKETP